jgi:hypothetical protein
MVKHRVAPYRPSYVVPAERRLEVVEAVACRAERGPAVGRNVAAQVKEPGNVEAVVRRGVSALSEPLE